MTDKNKPTQFNSKRPAARANEGAVKITPEEHKKAERIASALFELDPAGFEDGTESNLSKEPDKP